MLKHISFLLYLLFPVLLLSQSYTIEYKVRLNSIEKKGVLGTDKNDINFYYESLDNKSDLNSKEIKEDGNAEIKIIVDNSNDNKRYQFYNLAVDSLFNADYIGNDKVIYYEVFPTMDWTIMEETKIISKYTCRKATTTFRGRKYVAWFTLEIPLSWGPWKFNNTPGAILEVYDESLAFYWRASRFILDNNNLEGLEINKKNAMSIEQFVKESEKAKLERSNPVLLKIAERGGEIVKREVHRGRELNFKWEED